MSTLPSTPGPGEGIKPRVGSMMRLAWLTDIHLNFLDSAKRPQFLETVAERADTVAISGDIGESINIIQFLNEMEAILRRPIYFVLGNHDFCRGSIGKTRDHQTGHFEFDLTCAPSSKGAIMNRFILVTKIFLVLTTTAVAQDRPVPDPDTRPAKIWNRTGPLGETPTHVTDAFPLSDQENKGRWKTFEAMSDEFEGDALDPEKWTVGIYWWKGRQPALFSEENVTVSDGKLHLTMRKEKVPQQFEKEGYKDYTSAALQTKTRSSYGYYEVKAKPMNSAGSSSFWFQNENVPGWLTEIDVFEIGGKARGFERRYHMNLHVFRTPKEKKHWTVGGVWVAPWRLAEDYHVYGLEWGEEEIKYFVDGVVVRTVENTHWHQPLFLIFDSETMPSWFGMPEDEDLPSTYSIEYVRAWKKQSGRQ